MPPVLRTLLVLVPIGLLAGCGENPKSVAGTSARDPLDGLGQMLKELAEQHQKPPAKLAELESVEPMIPLAGPLIRSGELVYLWGVPYDAGSKKVAAYEKKAETEGGWVLLQDGTVQEMTAAEFAAAPKAK